MRKSLITKHLNQGFSHLPVSFRWDRLAVPAFSGIVWLAGWVYFPKATFWLMVLSAVALASWTVLQFAWSRYTLHRAARRYSELGVEIAKAEKNHAPVAALRAERVRVLAIMLGGGE